MMRKIWNKIRPLMPAVLLSAVISFMLFVYEPITMYAGNVNEFWFDLSIIIGPTLLLFLAGFVGLMLVFLIAFGVSRLCKKGAIYYITVITIFTLFVIGYIHGNFLCSALPAMNGDPIIWHNFTRWHVVSAVVCLVVLGLVAFGVYKLKLKKFIKYVVCIAGGGIFIMLLVSLTSTLITTDALKEKEMVAYATAEGMENYSNDENLLIFLVDHVEGEGFHQLLKDDPLYAETFEDFTFFPDTVEAYSLTRNSIPFIFSGVWDRNEIDFPTYSTNAYNNSTFFEELKNRDYQMYFYDNDFIWDDEKALEMENIAMRNKNINWIAYAKNVIKWDLLRYLPWPLKRFSRYEYIDFSTTQVMKPAFVWKNDLNYQRFKNVEPIKIDDKVFQYVHVEGAHSPYNTDENFNELGFNQGTYEQKMALTLKVIKAYLDRLRENGLYDNSAIIIMADHGFDYPKPNPILYIKGRNEEHAMEISDKEVWYPDLLDAYNQLLDGSTAAEAFDGVPDEHRERIFIQTPWTHEEHTIEWVQKGKAWDESTVEATGRTFDLKL